jgi:hypothetical protein
MANKYMGKCSLSLASGNVNQNYFEARYGGTTAIIPTI